jgi:L-fuconolactonase
MPSFPIIDTHVHLWDPQRLRYSWQHGNYLLERPYRIEDYQRATQGLDIEAMVFLECYADFTPASGQYLEELEFVAEEATREPRLKAIVAMAPLELGRAAAPLLADMVARFPALKGIRRIIEFEREPAAFMLNPRFIEGVRLLRQFGLHFEINVNFTQMDAVLDFLQRIPDVPLILDHCGKPGIKGSHLPLFHRHMVALAQHENLLCKLSDLPVEANWTKWTEEDLRPYIDVTLETFGIDRVIYGGDWPVCLQATSLHRWIQALDRALDGLSESELRQIYRDNANRFYRLGLTAQSGGSSTEQGLSTAP